MSTSNVHLAHHSKQTEAKTLAPKDLLRALQDFVNTGDEANRFKYFLKRWPGFLERDVEERTRAIDAEARRPIYKDQTGEPPKPFKLLRQNARLAWKGDEGALEVLLTLAFEPGKANPVMPDWRRGGFRYEPRTTFQAAMYELLKHSRQARVCANPDCPSPYFLTLDPRRKFCSVECSKPAQKEWRRSWWERHGKQWRKERASKTLKKRTHPTKRRTQR